MKKLAPVLILAVVAVAAWYLMSNKATDTQLSGNNNSNSISESANPALPPASEVGVPGSMPTGSSPGQVDDIEGLEDQNSRPAVEMYKSADEALKAVKDGANTYDDIILEQFTTPPDDCAWCDSFYKSIKELLASPDTKQDQRSYYAELLAISGRAENIKTIIEAIKNPASPDQVDIYAEALELTIGKDDVVTLISEQFHSPNTTLRDSSIAAVTNQGTRLAAETLYKFTAESNNPDGFYSLGIGLGEFVPDDETLPYLQSLAQKRDPYAHLAVKAMLNAGLPGLRLVVDMLANSTNADADRQLLKDAVDHVNYDEETEQYIKKTLETTKSTSAQEFLKSVQNDFSSAAAEDEEGGMSMEEDDEDLEE